jgi:Mrp family chromosome partitioning ATPase
MLSDPDGARSASFRVLRDNLIGQGQGLPNVLAVTSASPNEGKTTCAINLALAIAEHTADRLLLIDANFFSPTLAGILAVDEYSPREPSSDLPWVAPFKLSALTPCLHVATIVLSQGERFPQVDQRKLARLLDSFRRAGYEHIIMDAPALGGTPAVSQLMRVADGVLVTVRASRTTARALRRASEQIGASKLRGVVLMDSAR